MSIQDLIIAQAEKNARHDGIMQAYHALEPRLSLTDCHLLLDMAVRELFGTAVKQEKAA